MVDKHKFKIRHWKNVFMPNKNLVDLQPTQMWNLKLRVKDFVCFYRTQDQGTEGLQLPVQRSGPSSTRQRSTTTAATASVDSAFRLQAQLVRLNLKDFLI